MESQQTQTLQTVRRFNSCPGTNTYHVELMGEGCPGGDPYYSMRAPSQRTSHFQRAVRVRRSSQSQSLRLPATRLSARQSQPVRVA